jgi:hypothetical protein
MALWQIINPVKPDEEQWDDGLKAKPGEPTFTTETVEAYAGPKNFNYIGTPNWEPPAPAADATTEEGS